MGGAMGTQMNIRRHPEVDKTVQDLPQYVIESLELFEQRLRCNGDLSDFINTQPFSSKDAVGSRSRIEHYHLRPCQSVCLLVGLLRSVDTVYLLDVFEHPPQGSFTSSDIEERLYSRLSEVWRDFAEYKLPGTYRSGLWVQKKDKFGVGSVKGVPSLAPVRASNADYLPLGQLNNLSNGRTRVAIVVGTFVIPREEIPNDAIHCMESDEHQDWDTLNLYIAGWVCHLGVYRKETEQVILWFCSLHNVVVQASNRKKPVVVALRQEVYRQLLGQLRLDFPLVEGREHELGEMVDGLIRHFPLHRA